MKNFILARKIKIIYCECGKPAVNYLNIGEKFLPFCEKCSEKISRKEEKSLKFLEEKNLEPLKISASSRSAFSENINLHYSKKEKNPNNFDGLLSLIEGKKFEEEFKTSPDIFEKNFKFSHGKPWVKIKVLPKKTFDVYFSVTGKILGKFDKKGSPIEFYK